MLRMRANITRFVRGAASVRSIRRPLRTFDDSIVQNLRTVRVSHEIDFVSGHVQRRLV